MHDDALRASIYHLPCFFFLCLCLREIVCYGRFLPRKWSIKRGRRKENGESRRLSLTLTPFSFLFFPTTRLLSLSQFPPPHFHMRSTWGSGKLPLPKSSSSSPSTKEGKGVGNDEVIIRAFSPTGPQPSSSSSSSCLSGSEMWTLRAEWLRHFTTGGGGGKRGLSGRNLPFFPPPDLVMRHSGKARAVCKYHSRSPSYTSIITSAPRTYIIIGRRGGGDWCE